MSTINIGKLDPSLIDGPGRLLAGVVRCGSVTLDTEYGEYARWISVEATGTLSLVKWDGTTAPTKTYTSGVWHPVCSIKVNTSGTTATGILWGS